MHETIVAQQILRAVLAEMETRGATGCRSVEVDLGELEGLVPRDLQAAYDLVAADTLAEGAVLQVAMVPATGVCPSCQAARPFELPKGHAHELPRPICPECGSALELRGGRGFVVRRATLILEDP